MNRITLLALGLLSVGIATSASAQTKVTKLIIQNTTGTTNLSQTSGGFLVDNFLILQYPGNPNSTVTLAVPNTGSPSTFNFPAGGGTLLTTTPCESSGDAMIAAINLGTTQINEARLNLANYVTNSSLATTLLNYVTNSSLTTTLGNYVTNSYLTSNYTTTLAMNTAITNAIAAAGVGAGSNPVMTKGSISASNSPNNDITLGSTTFAKISGPTNGFGIRAIAGGTDGKTIVLYNTTAFNMTLSNLDGSAASGNRIITNGGTAVTTGAGSATLIYDSAADGGVGAWILLSMSI